MHRGLRHTLFLLDYQDSNLEKQDQNLLCYHYTIVQSSNKRGHHPCRFAVGLPGFEPGKTGPESVVLPLHHSPLSFCVCKGNDLFPNRQIFIPFFHSRTAHITLSLPKKDKKQRVLTAKNWNHNRLYAIFARQICF